MRLQAAGDITQAAAGIITANSLGVSDTTGNITLDQANVVGTNASAGTVAAQDTRLRQGRSYSRTRRRERYRPVSWQRRGCLQTR